MGIKKNKQKVNVVATGKPWQEFEKLVAKIEEFLSPSDADVKLNDMVPDIHTGTLRQVDATIRHKVGSTNLLIAIECRKRGSKQDVTWIEQLASKKMSIGASEMIGVSSTGFSSEAIQQARFKGVVLRKLDKVRPEDIVKGDQYKVVYREHNLRFVQLEFFDPERADAIDFLRALTTGSKSQPMDTLSIFRKSTQAETSTIMEIFSEFIFTVDSQGGLKAVNIPKNQQSVPHVLDISFADGNLLLRLPTREISVRRVKFEFTLGNVGRNLTATGHQIYSSGDNDLKIAEITSYQDEHEGKIVSEFSHRFDAISGKSTFEPVLGLPQLKNLLNIRPHTT